MARQPIETSTVTAGLALRQDCWPRELRGVCVQLDRAPAEALAAMTVRIQLRTPDEERPLRARAARLAQQYDLRQVVTCDGATCTIRLSRRAGLAETTGADHERP